MDKKQLRQQVINLRNGLTADERSDFSARIQTRLFSLPELKFARAVAGFMDFRNEVYMRDILNNVLEARIPLFLPRLTPDKYRMEFYAVSHLDDLIMSDYGILEPNPRKVTLGDLSHLSVVLTPGVAFSHDGYRLGYGGGYYDRFFQSISEDVERIGIAFECQMVSELPLEAHDIRLHRIVTEHHIYGPFKF